MGLRGIGALTGNEEPDVKCKRPEWHDGPCGEITEEDLAELKP